MVSTTSPVGLIGLPDLAEKRVERDRALALAHVRGATVAEIVTSTGINYRTVYRAIKREREWAKAQNVEAPPAEPGQG